MDDTTHTDTTANINSAVLHAALQFVNFLSNPTAVKSNVEQLLEASTAADAATDRLATASAALDEKKAAHEQQITAEREAHESQLQADRAQFVRFCTGQTETLKKREAVVSEGERKLAIDQQEIAEMRADLRARIAAINAAADPRPFPRAVPA